MASNAETSPLYRPDVSRRERRAIQEYNLEVIQNGIARYAFRPGRHQVFLEGLNVNGRLTNEATLTVYYQPVGTLLTYIQYPDHDGMLCRREVHASHDSMTDWSQETIPFWMIDASTLNTAEGYEGNGFGKALLLASEGLVPAWVKELGNPGRVVAHHYDGSHGAEEPADCERGYRTGWTGTILSELGYTNNESTLEYWLGENRLAQMGNPERNWIKLLRQ